MRRSKKVIYNRILKDYFKLNSFKNFCRLLIKRLKNKIYI